jgi:endoglycosylceramidase
MVYKLPPYDPEAAGFDDADARFLAHHGFDSVRLGTIYEAVEPQPGVYDAAYLTRIAETQRVLARHGIYSLVDFHQDLYTERFGGEGFPDWATLDDGAPAEPLSGFPATYITSPGENQAWNNFWANTPGPGGIGLQDRYAAAWKQVARRFRGEPYVMGYDLINEPWPGSQWPTCANTEGCPEFESQQLAPMEERAITAIRSVDSRHLVWYEPVVTSQFGTKYTIPDSGDPRAGMSFHTYCLPGALGIPGLADKSCPELEDLSLQNADDRAAANGDTLLLSEWGATDDVPTIERMADLADRKMVSWQWWHYCGCDDPTTSGPGDTQAIVSDPTKPPRGSNVFRDKLALIERPYPRAINGTPTSYSFDRDTTTFRLAFSRAAPSGKRLRSSLPSEVYVPRIHFPDGYRVRAKGVRAVSAPGARILKLKWKRGATQASVKVTPAGQHH